MLKYARDVSTSHVRYYLITPFTLITPFADTFPSFLVLWNWTTSDAIVEKHMAYPIFDLLALNFNILIVLNIQDILKCIYSS